MLMPSPRRHNDHQHSGHQHRGEQDGHRRDRQEPVPAQTGEGLALTGFGDLVASVPFLLQSRRREVLDEVTKHLAQLTRTTDTTTTADAISTDDSDAAGAVGASGRTDTAGRGHTAGRADTASMVDTLESERARRRACQRSPLTLARAARLLHALDQIAVRDMCAGWRDDPAWHLWCDLVGYAPPGHVAPVTTLIALVAAQRGDSASARVALERALADNPDYLLALLLQQALDYGTPPDVLTACIDEATNHPHR